MHLPEFGPIFRTVAFHCEIREHAIKHSPPALRNTGHVCDVGTVSPLSIIVVLVPDDPPSGYHVCSSIICISHNTQITPCPLL